MYFRHKFISFYYKPVYSFCTFKVKYHPVVILLKVVLNPKFLNNPLALCSQINLDILQTHTARFDKIGTGFPLFVFANLRVLLSVYFFTLQTVK